MKVLLGEQPRSSSSIFVLKLVPQKIQQVSPHLKPTCTSPPEGYTALFKDQRTLILKSAERTVSFQGRAFVRHSHDARKQQEGNIKTKRSFHSSLNFLLLFVCLCVILPHRRVCRTRSTLTPQ